MSSLREANYPYSAQVHYIINNLNYISPKSLYQVQLLQQMLLISHKISPSFAVLAIEQFGSKHVANNA